MRSVKWAQVILGLAGLSACFRADVDSDGDGTLDSKDCAPDDASIHPGAMETCNGLDDDCDGVVDNNVDSTVGSTWYADADGDGFGVTGSIPVYSCGQPLGYTDQTGDCDDTQSELSPETVWYLDADYDGFGDRAEQAETYTGCLGESGYVRNRLDCDDTNPTVHPEATEVCNDVDDDCDLDVDEGLRQEFFLDADADGYGDARSDLTVWACDVPEGYARDATDCDDRDANIHPDAERICGDGIDNACDAIVGRTTAEEFCTGEFAEAAVRIIGSHEGEAFGSSLTVLRDLYGPNDDAIAVGAPTHAADDEHVPGGVWVFRVEDLLQAGPAGEWLDPSIPTGEPGAAGGVLIRTGGDLDDLSSGLGAARDYDGDGVVDLVIGADRYDTDNLDAAVLPDQDGTSRSGGLFVVPGTVLTGAAPGTIIEAEPYLRTYGGARADWAGGSAHSGDINGDGISDVLTGLTGTSGWSASGEPLDLVGGVAVVFGTLEEAGPVAVPNLDARGRGLWIAGIDTHQYTVGQDLAVGDLSGDGFDDIAVGVVKHDSERGAVYIIEGPVASDMQLEDADTILFGADPNGLFGGNFHIDSGEAHPDCVGMDRSPSFYVTAQSTSDEGVVSGGGVYAFRYSDVRGAVVARAPSSSVGRIQGSLPDQQLGFGLTGGGYLNDGDCEPDLLVTGVFSSADDPRGHVLAFQGPLDGVWGEEDGRAYLSGEELFARSGWSHAFARAPSLVQEHPSGEYPSAYDAIVAGSDRFDRDLGTELPRLDAGAVHIFTSVGL